MSPKFLDGLVERSAAKAKQRAQDQLRTWMDEDERVRSFDICYGGGDLRQILSHRGPVVHVVVSDKAVYMIMRGGVVNKISVDQISDVRFEEPPDGSDLIAATSYAMAGDMARLVVITVWDGTTVGLLPKGRKAALFGPDLKALVPDRTVAEHTIEVGDGKLVRVVQKRGMPGSEGFDWEFDDGGADLDRMPAASLFREGMRKLMQEAGDPKADSPRA